MPIANALPEFRSIRRPILSVLAALLLIGLVSPFSLAGQTPKPAPPPPPKPVPAHPAAAKPATGKSGEAQGASSTEPKPAGHEGATPESAQPSSSEPGTGSNAEKPRTSTTARSGGTVVHRSHPNSARTADPDEEFDRDTEGESRRAGSTTGSTSTSTAGSTYSLPIRSSLVGSSASNTADAEARLKAINAARTRLGGVNRVPIPEGHILDMPGGRLTVIAGAGRSYSLRANGTLSAYRARGESATFRSDGKLASLSNKDLDLHLGLHGERTVTARRPDHSVLVSTGHRSGYYEPAPGANAQGDGIVTRTYLRGSKTWQRTYASYSYHGRALKRYMPAVAYSPAFLSWAWRGWPSPVNYQWIWVHNRWYVIYRPLFVVWPSYSGASFWLTDYFLGSTLDDGYAMQQGGDGSGDGAGGGSGGGLGDPGQTSDDDTAYAAATTAISPELKQAIAGQVQQQLIVNSMGSPDAAEADQSSTPAAPPFLRTSYLFVVDSPLNVAVSIGSPEAATTAMTASAQHCGLSTGDVLRLVAIPPDTALPVPSTVTTDSGSQIRMVSRPSFEVLEVTAGLRGDCPAGTQVRMPINALQEMENNFEARLDDGLQLLHTRQGRDGIPAAPAASTTPTPAQAAPADIPDAAALSAQLDALETQANQAAAAVTQTVLTAQTLP